MVQSNTMNKIINLNQVEKMLQHFESYNFIKLNNKGIQFSFLTQSLQEFVRKEWLQSNLLASDWPAFQFNRLKTRENLKTALEDIQSFAGTAPFSIIEVDNCQNEEDFPEPTSASEAVRNQFKKQTGKILSNRTFCPSENVFEIFHKKQRERKNWWRKLAAYPRRFVTANVDCKGNDKSVVSEIQAEFPWGLETVETIEYIPDFFSRESLPVEVNIRKRKKLPTQVVSCKAVLENVAFTYLCDSFGQLDGKHDRDLLRFDRKLAPFKLAIAGRGSTTEVTKSLEELSLLLAKQVRKLGFPVLFLSDACTTSIEQQLLRNDALGIPYTMLLSEKTLQLGFIGLRSRDTTLEEDSHVGVIIEYLAKILK